MKRSRPALGGGWALWPHALVRGAGFPFSWLDQVFRADDEPGALRRVAADPSFREAVAWQNRAAVEGGLDVLLRRPAGAADARTRRKLLLVAMYLQRYCAKNDTIGFFGPVGWATVQAHEARTGDKRNAGLAAARGAAGGLERHGDRGGSADGCRNRSLGFFSAGPGLVAARATFLEPWAVLALARACADEQVLAAAPVRLRGDLRLAGSALIGPGETRRLTAEERRVVQLADGRNAARLLRSLGRTDAARARWRAVLDRLVAAHVLRWEIPVALSLTPDRLWRDLYSSRCAEGALLALCTARDHVARSAGDATALGKALAALERTVEAYGVASRRNEGRTYGGRGLVFEECRRAVSLDLGRPPVERVAPALRLVLQVARWYTFTVAQALAAGLLRHHRAAGGGRIPLHVFYAETAPLFEADIPPAVRVASKELRTRWNRMWASATVGDVGQHLAVDAAARAVDGAFAAPCPGWPGARHHTVDLMWDAPSPEALLGGEGIPVLAELHPGVTAFTTLSVLSLCPVRDALEAEWAADLPTGMVSPIPWEDFARCSQDARLARRHWHLDVGGDFASDRPPRQVLRAADFDVIEKRGGLLAVHRGPAPDFDLLEIFERRIKLRAAVGFSLSEGVDSGPRRSLGPLVVQRAHWRIGWGPNVTSEQVRGWRVEHGLPDRVFVRSSEEVKPIYVDFASATSVETLTRLARRAAWLSFSEMYPGPDGLWLRDDAGRAYVSELRFIAVDPVPFDATLVWRRGP